MAGSTFSVAAKLVLNGVIGGVTSVLGKMTDKGVENVFYGQHHDLLEGVLQDFLAGAALGIAMSGGIMAGKKYGPGIWTKMTNGPKGVVSGAFRLEAGTRNAIEAGSFAGALAFDVLVEKGLLGGVAKPGITLGWWQVKEHI